MEHTALISNLDYLREQDRLDEYVNQFYFFLEQAVQQKDLIVVNKLLTAYLREVFYVDDRTRLHTLMERIEPTIMEQRHKHYQPMFYLIKGNLHYFSVNFERANVEYKKAVSFATEMNNFHVLGVALNNMLAAKIDTACTEYFSVTTMPATLLGMDTEPNKRKQYMLLLVHLEEALLLGKYTYAQHILACLRENLADGGLILREIVQLDILQLRIYVESGRYEQFFEALAHLRDDWAFQYDLQVATYEYAVQAATGLQNEVLFKKYSRLLEDAQQTASTANAQIASPAPPKKDELLHYMVPFTTVKKKAERHIARQQLTSYCVVMFHLDQDELTDEEVKMIQASIHSTILPKKLPLLFGCTMVSEQKMLYVLKTTEAAVLPFLNMHIKPLIQQYRSTLKKQFRVIISYVQNDLYGYDTFEQTLQYAYALLYYASYNGEGALLNA